MKILILLMYLFLLIFCFKNEQSVKSKENFQLPTEKLKVVRKCKLLGSFDCKLIVKVSFYLVYRNLQLYYLKVNSFKLSWTGEVFRSAQG